MVCFRYIIVDTLYIGDRKGDDDDDNNNNNNNNLSRQMEQSFYWFTYWLQVKHRAVQFSV